MYNIENEKEIMLTFDGDKIASHLNGCEMDSPDSLDKISCEIINYVCNNLDIMPPNIVELVEKAVDDIVEENYKK